MPLNRIREYILENPTEEIREYSLEDTAKNPKLKLQEETSEYNSEKPKYLEAVKKYTLEKMYVTYLK